jgi:3-oxoacyl-[acyl-carrier-protein] synthase-1
MALVPEDVLEPLAPEVDGLAFNDRYRRTLRVAAHALQQVAAQAGDLARVPMLLALPEPAAGAPPPSGLLLALQKQSGVAFDQGRSRLLPNGRAGALLALEQAAPLFEQGAEYVMVGGADTCSDSRWLHQLESEGRLLTRRSLDGFVPGEGAAFLLLAPVPRRAPSGAAAGAVTVVASASAEEPEHLYAQGPATGEGLANCFETLRAAPVSLPPVRSIWAGFNGEGFWAKEWGVARLRHADLFDPAADIQHPADCYGDLGAATGAMLMVLAERALAGGGPSPALVFASSDRETRGCVTMSATG